MNTEFGRRWAAIVGRYPDQEAVRQADRFLTYGQLAAQANDYANCLIGKRIQGQCIPVLVEDTLGHIAALLGVVLSGNYYCSLHPDRFQTVSEVLALVPAPLLIASDARFGAGGGPAVPVLRPQALPLPAADVPLPSVVLKPDMAFCLFMTSGSTGIPKQIIHSHQSLLLDTDRQIADNHIGPADRIDLLFSLEFSASLACLFPALLTGSTLLVHDLKKEGVLSLPAFWQQQRITFSTLSVSSLRLLLKTSCDFKILRNLRLLSVGAEPVAQGDVTGFQNRFAPHTRLQIAYATETRTIAEHKIQTGTPWAAHLASVGKAVPGRTVRIRAEDGQWLEEPGQIGEIIVQARHIPHEYTGNPAASGRAYGRLPTGEVQYATGDLGYMDADGYLYWCGRTDFMVKINGQKVNLLQLEDELRQAPDVREVAVVCDTSVLTRPVITAFLGTEPSFDLPAVKQWLAARLPPVGLPDRYQLVSTLPRTRTGKIDRPELLRQQQANPIVSIPDRRANAPDSLLDTIKRIWAAELNYPNPIADYDDFFRDLGGDSLTAEGCLAALEQCIGQPLVMQAAFSYPTPQALASFMATPPGTGVQCISLNLPQPNRPHVYFIPPLEGDRRVYQGIENALGIHANLYCIFYSPFSPDGHLRSFAELAGAITGLIDTVSPNFLVGYSFGGILAYEVAWRLNDRGAPEHPLNRLVLLDTPLYRRFPFHRVVAKDLKRSWKRLASSIRTGTPIPWKGGVRSLLTRYQARVSTAPAPQLPAAATTDWKRKAELSSLAYSRLVNVKAPVRRPIVLIRASDTSFFERDIKPDYNWQAYTTAGLEEHLLVAHHTQVLNQANSQQIARILLRILVEPA